MMFQRVTLIVGYDEKESEKPSKWDWATALDAKTGLVIEAGNPRTTAFDAGRTGLVAAVPINEPWAVT
jgi:hypothetical protein